MDVWDQYWNAYDSTELNSNVQLAQTLHRKLATEGIDLDLIYAEISMVPHELDQYPSGKIWARELARVLSVIRKVHDRLGKRPDGVQLLGYDISHPVPSFHSAIFQPGLHERRPCIPEYLNSAGLLEDIDLALRFLSAANEMDYGSLPFCVVGIWEVGG